MQRDRCSMTFCSMNLSVNYIKNHKNFIISFTKTKGDLFGGLKMFSVSLKDLFSLGRLSLK